MVDNLKALVTQLKRNPSVIGLARYGSRSPADLSAGGDFDLFVFVEDRPHDIESIHFYVAGIPVDLNIRCLEDLHRLEPLTPFDTALIDAEILYDRIGTLPQELAALDERWQREPGQLTEHGVNMRRFCQQHVLDKARGRTATDRLLCQFLLATNIYWLVEAYFAVRCLHFPGEKHALKWLSAKEPQIHAEISRFYESDDLDEKLEMNERLTELVLAPVGGPWRRDELMVLATGPDAVHLLSQGETIFRSLLGTTVNEYTRGS